MNTGKPSYNALNTYTKLMRAAESVTGRVNRNMTSSQSRQGQTQSYRRPDSARCKQVGRWSYLPYVPRTHPSLLQYQKMSDGWSGILQFFPKLHPGRNGSFVTLPINIIPTHSYGFSMSETY